MWETIWNWIVSVDLTFLIRTFYNLSMLLIVGMFSSKKLRQYAYAMFNVGICLFLIHVRMVLWLSATRWTGQNGSLLASILDNDVLKSLFYFAILGRLAYVFSRSTFRLELASVKKQQRKEKLDKGKLGV